MIEGVAGGRSSKYFWNEDFDRRASTGNPRRTGGLHAKPREPATFRLADWIFVGIEWPGGSNLAVSDAGNGFISARR